MFIGHFALGLAGKKLAPRTSLGTLMLSTAFVDVLWPCFLFLGWEHARIVPGITAAVPLDLYDYPYSHSLVAGVIWGVLFGACYFAATRYGRGAWILALGVLSHWLLDFASHRPDMPLWLSGGPHWGLGLWYSIPATIAVETALFAFGIFVYTRVTRARDGIGRWGLAGFLGFLYLVYLGNLFGPPPPSLEALEVMGPVSLALFAIPYWVDRHRVVERG